MIRKKFIRKEKSALRSPNYQSPDLDHLFPPDQFPSSKSHQDLSGSNTDIHLTPQGSLNSMTLVTLSSESMAVDESSPESEPIQIKTITKPPRPSCQVSLDKSNNSGVGSDNKNWEKFQNEKVFSGKEESPMVTLVDLRSVLRRDSSEASTPHLFTDYQQRLHNILLLNVSTSSLFGDND